MNDRDDSPKGFLERWSRKKIESEAPDAPAESDAPQPEAPGLPQRVAKNDARAPAEAAAKPEFDLASLPSLESITAVTDIRGFLAPGVPRELARAALRRAWTADPAIRDFKGLAENDWDFTDPTAMPGFGPLPEGYDVKKLLAQIFSDDEKRPAPETAPEQPPVLQLSSNTDENASPATVEEAAAVPVDAEEVPPPQISDDTQVPEVAIVQCTNNIASQQSISDDETVEPKNRRQHGSALPQ